MKIGLQIPRFTWPDAPASIGPSLARIVRQAEDAGYDSIWVMDHLFQIRSIGRYTEPMLEAYTTLGFLAGVTSRVRLGAMVSAVTLRHPGILVKQVSALDVLSGGRASLGIGAAWNAQEHIGLGIPFPPVAERFERLEETLQIAHQMWRGDTRPFHGRHYQLEEPVNVPPPLQAPHPPILVGGGGERKTLRLVATYADAWNVFGFLPHAQLVHKLGVLREHCARVERDPAAIEKTALLSLDPEQGVDRILRRLDRLRQLGFDTIITSHPGVETLRPIDTFAREVLPRLG
ncbi:MAG: LLM class F420-dependent oxidoreductase [Chloroflexi bacterium]|nr:LLM class F420-dependent oxidoreductase [Chloroflexota bacterium]